ncbi:MAG TPA: hypothetical protein VLJ62_09895 [Burkholderiaceae bacterium]|nr:hypothetical protein [Burkholderiaceae bacterium]
MHLALSAVASRLNLDVLAKLPELQAPKVPPPPPEPPAELAISAKSLAQLADDWCGTVPRKFPFPVPPNPTLDDGWCGTVPRPLPGPIPPTPPQPWLDLANAAQSFR